MKDLNLVYFLLLNIKIPFISYKPYFGTDFAEAESAWM